MLTFFRWKTVLQVKSEIERQKLEGYQKDKAILLAWTILISLFLVMTDLLFFPCEIGYILLDKLQRKIEERRIYEETE